MEAVAARLQVIIPICIMAKTVMVQLGITKLSLTGYVKM